MMPVCSLVIKSPSDLGGTEYSMELSVGEAISRNPVACQVYGSWLLSGGYVKHERS